MTVSCRVVGIFFNAMDLPYTEGMTVKDLLDQIAANPGTGNSGASHFGYIANQDILTTGHSSVVAFAARYPKGVTSITSGTPYTAGDYYLSEQNVGSPRYSVWQYYVLDKNKTVSKNPEKLQSFSTRQLKDGDEVIWRLVEILSGPNLIPRVYQNALKFGGAERSVYGYVQNVSGVATLISGSGVETVTRTHNGVCEVEFSTPFTSIPAVVATQRFNLGSEPTNPGDTRDNAVVVEITEKSCIIQTGDSLGARADRDFSFVATGI
ncbi:MAG: hypothetical protein JJ894_08680 [Dinoroseobacter sp.]|nr:hypothetical protein [Dinoroseobacter sp.]